MVTGHQTYYLFPIMFFIINITGKCVDINLYKITFLDYLLRNFQEPASKHANCFNIDYLIWQGNP